MEETRQNKEGTLIASFHRNPTLSHSPSHRYTVTLTKKGRVTETTINRHEPTIAAARRRSKTWTDTGKAQ